METIQPMTITDSVQNLWTLVYNQVINLNMFDSILLNDKCVVLTTGDRPEVRKAIDDAFDNYTTQEVNDHITVIDWNGYLRFDLRR